MAGLRQHGMAGVAMEQLDAEGVLKRLDLMADRRAGNAELIGRQPERAEPGRRLEGGQGAQAAAERGGAIPFTQVVGQSLYSIGFP